MLMEKAGFYWFQRIWIFPPSFCFVLEHDMPVKYWPVQNTKKNSSPLSITFSSNKIEFMDLDNMERIDWKKAKMRSRDTEAKKKLGKIAF